MRCWLNQGHPGGHDFAAVGCATGTILPFGRADQG